MDVAQDFVVQVLSGIGSCTVVLLGWMKWNRASLTINIKRTERLYGLLKTGAWRTCHPTALQLACEQAFKTLYDDREIRDSLSRHNGLGRIRERQQAGHRVRWDATVGEYVDNRALKFISPNIWMALAMLGLTASVPGGVWLTAISFEQSVVAGSVAVVESIVVIAVILASLSGIASARNLLKSDSYPLLTQGKSAAADITTLSDQSVQRKRGKRQRTSQNSSATRLDGLQALSRGDHGQVLRHIVLPGTLGSRQSLIGMALSLGHEVRDSTGYTGSTGLEDLGTIENSSFRGL
jgi:hypothetical protein